MKTYVALLRGINVGGKHSLPMKELVALLEELGATNPKTYIQSGNAVFQSAEKDAERLARRLAAGIEKRRGFEPCVMILEVERLRTAAEGNPFPEATADPASLHVSFLEKQPKSPDLARLEKLKKASERFHLGEGVFYLHAPEGVGRSKLAAGTEKILGVRLTDRNWRTVGKLMELADEIEAAAAR